MEKKILMRSVYLDSRATHREYYAQFVDDRTIDYVVRNIGADRLLASTDPHLNDIPLYRWDELSRRLPLAMSFRNAEDWPTLCGLVCAAKEAARQWIEEQRERIESWMVNVQSS